MSLKVVNSLQKNKKLMYCSNFPEKALGLIIHVISFFLSFNIFKLSLHPFSFFLYASEKELKT